MDSLREFGAYLRRKREERGFPSARAFALHARLSDSHVGKFERGQYRPRWKTANRLTAALRLTASEREEFLRLWTAAGIPNAARPATTGPPVPGLVLWKHLPGPLYAVKHDFRRWHATSPDDIAAQAVRAAGSLLGWVALCQRPPAAAARAAVIRIIADMLRERRTDAAAPAAPPVESVPRAAEPGFLCEAWRRFVFGDPRQAGALARALKSWTFREERGFDEPGLFSFHFRRPALAADLDITLVTAENIVAVHDAMLSHQLWDTLQLGGGDTGLSSSAFVRWCPRHLPQSFAWLFREFSPGVVGRSLARTDGTRSRRARGFNAELAESLIGLTRYVRMAVRTFQVPSLYSLLIEDLAPTGPAWVQNARDILGDNVGAVVDLAAPDPAAALAAIPPADTLRAEILDRCTALEQLIQEAHAAYYECPAPQPLDAF